MTKPVLVLLAVIWISGCIIVIADDDVERPELDRDTRTLTLAAADLSGLVAITGAGRLELIGEAAREEIEVSADIHYQDAEDVDLRLERRGNQARLVANLGSGGHRSGWGRIDLVVRVPARFDLDLEDGSGAVDIRGLTGAVLIEDGSGPLTLDGGASATIKDGSGEIRVNDVGALTILEEGSGGLSVRNVRGATML